MVFAFVWLCLSVDPVMFFIGRKQMQVCKVTIISVAMPNKNEALAFASEHRLKLLFLLVVGCCVLFEVLGFCCC